MSRVATMVCVLIVIQLVVYIIAVMLLTLLGWLADKLSRPLSPRLMHSEPGAGG